jgi:hypothetical protein
MTDSNNCEYCTHCQTINDDMDNYCHLQQRVVHEVCAKFEHFEFKVGGAEEAGGKQ